ncbi:TPA: hypothetical protein ACIQMB_003857 [Bacillus pacificus]|nr:hypothetical protein COE56_22185 [Bacillus anthracis]RAS91204.1 hypothetical protein A6E21_24400 [Bacillus cereus]RAS98463.1 hypothetical protein A6E25_22595 [Bacillus cereus]RAT04353.1 hypothetical protein A6E27_16490 [Bacillus cereus]
MLKKWFENFLDESHCKHKYSFIKMQDNEDFRSGRFFDIEREYITVEQLLVVNKNIRNAKVIGLYSV